MLGNNGLIAKARDAKTQTEQDAMNTQTAMNSLYEEVSVILGENSELLPLAEGTTPWLSTGYTPEDGTDLDTGFVIQDELGNEQVVNIQH